MGQRKWQHPSRTPTYSSWDAMHARCTKPTNAAYPDYGGRGITVCEKWDSYDAFYDDMGEKPEGMTLDRIDNDKGYEPDNCRWATPKQQNRNSRFNVTVTYRGKTQCLAAWAEELGLRLDTVWVRLTRGDDVERALRPVRGDN